MSLKTNIEAVKLKQALSKAKQSTINILKEVKSININLDLANKKANIEVSLK